MKSHRLMKVSRVTETTKNFNVTFDDSMMTISMSKNFLAEKGIAAITAGQEFLVQGSAENGNFQLANPVCLGNIKKE